MQRRDELFHGAVRHVNFYLIAFHDISQKLLRIDRAAGIFVGFRCGEQVVEIDPRARRGTESKQRIPGQQAPD